MVTLLPIECVRGGLKENYAFTSLLLTHSLMRDILWHEELFDLLCMYSHVVTVANVVH